MTYMEQMKEDIREAIRENYRYEVIHDCPRESVETMLNDDLWIDDSVTGNGSGSYYCNRAKAREQVLENGIKYLYEAVKEGFSTKAGIGNYFINDDWEGMDVEIRCFLLGRAISEVLDEIL